MPSDHNTDGEILAAWLDEVERHWRVIGVRRAERRRLRVELHSDLADALADGAPLASLIAETPSNFAEQVADASDVSYGPPPAASNGALVATALSGGAAGAVVAWNFVYPYPHTHAIPIVDGMSETAVAILLHTIAGAVVLAFALAAMWWRFRHDDTMKRTVIWSAPLIVLTGIASIPPTVLFATYANFSFNPLVLLAEFAIVAAFVAVGILWARKITLRRGPKQVA